MTALYSITPPEVDRSAVLRYMRTPPSVEMLALIDDCLSECKDLFAYKVCFSTYPIKKDEGGIHLGTAHLASLSLAKHLDGCREALLLAATVGLGIDRLIAKYGTLSPTRALCLQAIGTERVEALCDEAERHILSLLPHGSRLCPRYSPGYGDLPLSAQQAVFSLLSPEKSIGLYLNASLLMSPTKSVTAVIGILRKEDSV